MSLSDRAALGLFCEDDPSCTLEFDQDDQGRDYACIMNPREVHMVIPDHHSTTPLWVLWRQSIDKVVASAPTIPGLIAATQALYKLTSGVVDPRVRAFWNPSRYHQENLHALSLPEAP